MGRRRKRARGLFFWLSLVATIAAWLLLPREEEPQPRPRHDSTYQRDDWRHWIDADGDCQDTRHEVLVAESHSPVRFKRGSTCHVTQGRWHCPYTDRWFTHARDVDVDHLVPLHHAHQSGGASWTAARKEQYANALGDPEHLVAVSKSANRAKGSKGPDAWLPEHAPSRCSYVEHWVRIKDAWDLTTAPEEQRAIDHIRTLCRRGAIPPAPQTPSSAS